MNGNAAEQLSDPLVTPLLALLKDAVNADLGAEFEAQGITPEDMILTTLNRPVTLDTMPASLSMPVLVCYRIRQQGQQRTFGHRDQLVTLRLQYISTPCASDRLDDRWPILDRVWIAAIEALRAGHHADHLADQRVVEGIVWLNENPTKLEGYLPGTEGVYPTWEADVQVTWRDLEKSAKRTVGLFPVLSLRARLTQQLESDGREPAGDVVIVAYTPEGLEELDAEPHEEEAVLP